MDAKKLAYYLTQNIIVFHDNVDYVGLKKNSQKLLDEMGYKKNVAEKISENIKQIYILYDKAQTEYEKRHYDSESKLYSKSKEYADKINSLSKDDYDTKDLIEIVIAWRHRKKLLSTYKIFKYWKNIIGILPAIRCTFLQINAGRAHDSRKGDSFQDNFSKIYSMLLSKNRVPILF